MKFSIRDLLLVTVIVALALGWWIDRSRLAIRANESEMWRHATGTMEFAIRKSGWHIRWKPDRSQVDVMLFPAKVLWKLDSKDYEPGVAGELLQGVAGE
jgi:hypothetical protein